MGIISYAQNFEDVLLNRVFGGVNYGFYVDIGAYHPVDDNVTKAFYDRGWSGINIEPGEVFPELAAARTRDINLNMAVYDRAGELSFAQHPGWYAGLSYVQDGENADAMVPASQPEVTLRTVACDTLTNILTAHASRRPIAFLKIDAEGAELAIIRSTDWRVIRPTVLLIEATMPLSNQLDNQDWEPILIEQGYVRACFDGINCFYVPEERRDLLRHFEIPVNVLDGFSRYDAAAARCREELQAAHERIHTLSSDLVRVSAENAEYAEQKSTFLELMRTHTETMTEMRQRLATAEASALEQHRIVLAQHRLVHELRWPDGPGAVRAVLPLARIIRRISGQRGSPAPALAAPSPAPTAAVASSSAAFGPPGTALVAPSVAIAPPTGAPRRSLAKRVVMIVYGVFRPVLRPLAWRSRGFLIGELRSDLTRLELQIQQLGAGRHAPSAVGDTSVVEAELKQFGKMLETTLLTLALDGERPGPE